MKNFFKDVFNFRGFPFDFPTLGLFKDMEITNNSTTGTLNISTVVDGIEFKTDIDKDRNVVLSITINVDESKDAQMSVINIVLNSASSYFSFANSIVVNLTMNGRFYTFNGNMMDQSFDVVLDDGQIGRATSLPSDGVVKEWVIKYAEDSRKDDNYTTTSTEDVVDETHVYTDDEMDKYANFMCNVVCGDCERNTCEGCEVVGESDNNENECECCVCDDCDGCGVVCPLSDQLQDEDEKDIIPDTLDDCDFANFIKSNNRHIVDYDTMMDNLRHALKNNIYEVEDNYVIVPMEDIIKGGDFLTDIDIVDIVLGKEQDRLESFLVQATNRFGFKSFKYGKDLIFGLIDFKFELPE